MKASLKNIKYQLILKIKKIFDIIMTNLNVKL